MAMVTALVTGMEADGCTAQSRARRACSTVISMMAGDVMPLIAAVLHAVQMTGYVCAYFTLRLLSHATL